MWKQIEQPSSQATIEYNFIWSSIGKYFIFCYHHLEICFALCKKYDSYLSILQKEPIFCLEKMKGYKDIQKRPTKGGSH